MPEVNVNKDLCIGCGDCILTCPYKCFHLIKRDDKEINEARKIEVIEKWGINPESFRYGPKQSQPVDDANEKCIACRSCQIRCLTFAITIKEEAVV